MIDIKFKTWNKIQFKLNISKNAFLEYWEMFVITVANYLRYVKIKLLMLQLDRYPLKMRVINGKYWKLNNYYN